MNDQAVVCRGQALCDLYSVVRSLAHGDGAFGQALAQGLPLEQFRNQVGGTALETDVINGKYVGMVKRGSSPSLLLKAAQMVGVIARSRPDQLQGNITS